MKHPTNPQDETPQGRGLYPEGVKQLTELGTLIRDRYTEATSSASAVTAYSSSLQRTQMSSRAFLSGLYPTDDTEDGIPIVMLDQPKSDWRLRGYAMCPKLAEKFDDFVQSSAFKDREKKDGDFVKQRAEELGLKDDKVKMQNVFNIFDQHLINFRGYAESSSIGKLSEADMKRLTKVADWYESRKFQYSTHEVPVARGLVKQIRDEMVKAKDGKDGKKLIEYSAHYPTMLTLLATLRKEGDGDPAAPANAIPDFGAALLFELHREDGREVVKLQYYGGPDSSSKEITPIAIGTSGCKEVEGCAFDTFSKDVEFANGNVDDFCKECGGSTACSACEQQDCGGGGSKVVAGVVGGAIGLGLGLVAMWVFLWWGQRRKGRVLERLDDNFEYDENGYPSEIQS